MKIAMNNKQIEETIKQVLYNPQVSNPPISYKITDVMNGGEDYTSEYIDIGDFESYKKRLEKRLILRLTTNKLWKH